MSFCCWQPGWLPVAKVPDDILSEKKMQAVQVDMQLAEAMINLDSKAFSDNARKEALYQSIFRKYDITQAEYDSSLIWYGRHLDIYMKVYDRVLADLNKRQKALGDVQAFGCTCFQTGFGGYLASSHLFKIGARCSV